MIESLILAAEGSALELMVKLHEICCTIASGEAIEKVAPLARKVSEIRKGLEKYTPDPKGIPQFTTEQRSVLQTTVPNPTVAQLYRVVTQVAVEIEQRLATLLAHIRNSDTLEIVIPLAREVSDLRKAIMKDRSFRQTIALSEADAHALSEIPTTPQSQGGSPNLLSPTRTEMRKHSRGTIRTEAFPQAFSAEKLPELRAMIMQQILELRSRLDALSAKLAECTEMEEAVKSAKLLSQSRKEMDKVKDPSFEFPDLTDEPIAVPSQLSQSMRDLFRAANQVMRETNALVDHIKQRTGEVSVVDELLRILKSVRDSFMILDGVNKTGNGSSRNSTEAPSRKIPSVEVTPSAVENTPSRPNPAFRSTMQFSAKSPEMQALKLSLGDKGHEEQAPIQPKPPQVEAPKPARPLTSSIPASVAENYLRELRKASGLVISDIKQNMSLLQRRVGDVKEISGAMVLLKFMGDIKKPLSKFSGRSNWHLIPRNFSRIQDGFMRVLVLVLDDIICRFKHLCEALNKVAFVEDALPLAKNLNDLRSMLEGYFRKLSSGHTGAFPARPARSSFSGTEAAQNFKSPGTFPVRPSNPSAMTAPSYTKDITVVSLESIISEMKKCCEPSSGQKESEIPMSMDKKIMRLQQLTRKDLEETKTAAELEKYVSTIQKEIVSLDAQRHKLSLAVHNVERKIQLAVKAQKMDEDDEIFQFFDESAQTDHPLGNQKERYENILYLLRQTPEYITEMMPYIPHEAVDSVSQTITGALFSDMFFYREEAMLLNLIKQVMAKAFEDCNDVSNFLRRNSLLTKLMAGYTKRQSGRLYLNEILKRDMELLFEGDTHSLEMDPGKILVEVVESQGKTENQATEEDRRKADEILTKNSSKLQQFCAAFLKSIISRKDAIPFGIRWLSKEMVRVAHTKFPTMGEKDDGILIGSFIFLRFIIPAIMTPEVYGINGAKVITPRQRRNLILCSKVLQNLANDVEFGEKEVFMLPMNEFMKQSRGFLFDYFKFIVDVVEPEEYYHLLSGSTSSLGMLPHPITVTPNELFLIHRILLQNHSEIIKDTGDPLMKLLFEMGPAREPLPKSKNKYMVLDVLNLDRSDWIANQSNNIVKILKDKLFGILKSARHIPPHPNPNATLCDVLESMRKVSDTSLIMEIEFIQKKLQAIEVSQRQTVEQDIITEIEKEIDGRRVYRGNLNREKEELTIALSRQQKMVEDKMAEKKIYTEYFSNIQKRSFILKVGNSPDKRIGPFSFTLKELEKQKLVEKSSKADAFFGKSGLVIEFSSTAPGSIVMLTKVKDDSRSFHIDISQLLDDMVVRDTVEFGGLTFDLRRFVTFLHSKFIG